MVTVCPRCHLSHENIPAACPYVKAVDYYENGLVRRIEYFEFKLVEPSKPVVTTAVPSLPTVPFSVYLPVSVPTPLSVLGQIGQNSSGLS